MIQNLIAGKCPHVQDTTPPVTNSVYGMYIAAAVSSHYVMKKYLLGPKQGKVNACFTQISFESRLFNIKPYQIAILKNSEKVRFLGTFVICWIVMLEIRDVKYVDSSPVIDTETCSRKVYIMTDLELCVMVKNLQAFAIIAGERVPYEELYNILDASETDAEEDMCCGLKGYILAF